MTVLFLKLLLSLFDTYVASILNYICEVWSNHKCDVIEQVQMTFLKRILKVKASTVLLIIWFIVSWGRYPMFIVRYCRMLKYWFKLLCTDNCILRCCYEEMLDRCSKKTKKHITGPVELETYYTCMGSRMYAW